MPNPEKFLQGKYQQLHKSEEAQRAAERHGRKEKRTIEKPTEVNRAFLRDLDQIHMGKIDEETGERIPPDPDKKERIKAAYHKSHVISPENVSDKYIKGVLLGNFAEQKGYDQDKLQDEKTREYIQDLFEKENGVSLEEYQIPEEQREEVAEAVIRDQETSFDAWYDYLTSSEASNVPLEFRYWVFESLKKLGAYDKGKKRFTARSEKTIASYPELNQQALANVLDEIERKYKGRPSGASWLSEEKQKELQELLKEENFGKLYAFAQERVNELQFPIERLPITRGEWREFPQGSDPQELTQTLQGFNTAWCIAGEGYASSYLSRSDIHIYYSEDAEGQNSIPRSTIVTDGRRISEVRGIAQKGSSTQHMDDYIAPVVQEKLGELEGGKEWEESMEDMQKLAEIHTKHLKGEELNKDDLTFLYELEHPIRSMGYQRDPRIKELRAQRDFEEDMPVVFECTQEQIAHSPEEVTEDTKAYVGELQPGIFNLLQTLNIEHVYTEFPESKIRFQDLEIGGKTKQELIREMEEEGIGISSYAREMLESPNFTTNPDKERETLIRLKSKDLGFKNGATMQEIYERAEELGLDLCPAETGPHLRLKDTEQALGDWYRIAMKPISDRNGDPRVFGLDRDGDGPWLYVNWASPGIRWNPGIGFVFRLRPDIGT